MVTSDGMGINADSIVIKKKIPKYPVREIKSIINVDRNAIIPSSIEALYHMTSAQFIDKINGLPSCLLSHHLINQQ